MNKSQAQQGSIIPKIIASIAVCGALAVGAYFVLIRKPDAGTSVSTASQTATPALPANNQSIDNQTAQAAADTGAAASTSTQSTTVYKNGTYKYSQDYAVPKGGQNTLNSDITIENDVVTAISTNSTYDERDSVPYINGFKSNISGAIVGKKLAEISVSRIGGASLTTRAFSSVLSQLQNEAKN
jgi:hypothetical protein